MTATNETAPTEKPPLASRRRVIRVALAASVVGGSPFLWRGFRQWAQSSLYQDRADFLLQTRVDQLHLTRVDLRDVLDKLAVSFNVPISSISDDLPVKVSVNVTAGTVEEVLNQIVRSAPNYQWRTVRGRIVVLPRTIKYDRQVSEIHIVSAQRAEAAEKYLECLNARFGDFKDYTSGILIGEFIHHRYTDQVTLMPDATVLEHFVQLLGTDYTLRFGLSRGKDNLSFYSLGNVAFDAFPVPPLEKWIHKLFAHSGTL